MISQKLEYKLLHILDWLRIMIRPHNRITIVHRQHHQYSLLLWYWHSEWENSSLTNVFRMKNYYFKTFERFAILSFNYFFIEKIKTSPLEINRKPLASQNTHSYLNTWRHRKSEINRKIFICSSSTTTTIQSYYFRSSIFYSFWNFKTKQLTIYVCLFLSSSSSSFTNNQEQKNNNKE